MKKLLDWQRLTADSSLQSLSTTAVNADSYFKEEVMLRIVITKVGTN